MASVRKKLKWVYFAVSGVGAVLLLGNVYLANGDEDYPFWPGLIGCGFLFLGGGVRWLRKQLKD